MLWRVDEALAVRVVDGDTVQLGDGTRVRLSGVDISEPVHPSSTVEEYGEEASAFTRQMLEGTTVFLEYDVERMDRNGRTLAYVGPVDGTFLKELLLSAGYVQVATFPPNVKYVERFFVAEPQARAEGRGLRASGGDVPPSVEGPVSLNAELAVFADLFGEPMDLTGWVPVSVQGNQRFTCPLLVLAPGETVTVMSGRGAR